MAAKTLFGRERQLTEIEAVLARLTPGRPSVVLISGEAGSGKTSLLRAAAGLLPTSDWLLAEGYGLPGQGIPPYFATARVLRRLVPLLSPSGLEEVRPALATARLIDGTSPAVATGADRLALLESIARTIDLAAAGRPVMLTFDDMQWAGSGDWDVVTHLVRAVDAPLAVVIAARDEGFFDPSGAAARARVELNRQRALLEVRATALPDEAIQSVCDEVLGGIASEQLVRSITAHSDGNPFLVEEIAAHLRRTGRLERAGEQWRFTAGVEPSSILPESIQLGTATQLATLAPATRILLHRAATAGRAFEADALLTALADTAALEGCLAEAIREGLVVPGEAGHWSFRHDLVREAVLADIPLAARPAHHRQVALALEARAPTAGNLARLSSLSYHWRQADEPEAAARAALDASVAATHAFAPEEALQFAEQALSAAQQVPGDPGQLTRALVRLGDAQTDAGRYAEAEATFDRLLESARARGDQGLVGQAWLRLGVVARRREQPETAARALTEALAALEPLPGQDSNRGRILVELASIGGLTTASYASAEEFANRALAIARDLGDRGLEAEALVALGNCVTRAAGPRAARPMLEDALARAEAGGRLSLACDTAAGLSNNYYWAGELRRARYFAERRLELATRAHDIFGLRHGHSWLALLAASRGEWDVALNLLAEAEPMLSHLASPEPVGFIRVISAFVHHRTGDDARAASDITEAVGMLEPLGAGTMLWYGSLAALIYHHSGWTSGAIREAEAQENRLRDIPASALPARSARAALGLVYAAMGDRERAKACTMELQDFPDDYHWSPVRRTLAASATLDGERDRAAAILREAETRARAEGNEPDLGLILLDLAKLMLAAGRVHSPELDEAASIFGRLRMRREDRIARELAAQRAASPRLPAGLSAREVEVLRLLARGLTNRQIAEELVLSERTIANHVTSIYTKAGVENRAGATAFAARHGLLATD